ncbi:MAG: 30S ribosomal protein S11 [Candidatus Woykebacteria bacterium GWB1_45_5]|uniref:Small ribosomal subunit protein uS11 n=2 Tax=Candidatus Woykeibacteriota TaxID=1817899 RepID=A0A1G1W2S9_9BACT|nr:MAG: 30S ribosomal protein S11 [Candidatus Woykebacteria bacterium GWA1_44_8]OGY23310.1 MAG: 30S ribosomal protein S11 [Candidatus Woykebacteria bacterium GWB1_45_5]
MAKAKKQPAKDLSLAKIYINATFNNTLITITDAKGDTIAWGSSGSTGFKGARKSTPYAATTAAEVVAKKAVLAGARDVEVYIKGPGSGRDAAIKALRNSGLRLKAIADVTPIPHNGPRPRKRRRV